MLKPIRMINLASILKTLNEVHAHEVCVDGFANGKQLLIYVVARLLSNNYNV
jgi:hypothetical protein